MENLQQCPFLDVKPCLMRQSFCFLQILSSCWSAKPENGPRFERGNFEPVASGDVLLPIGTEGDMNF